MDNNEEIKDILKEILKWTKFQGMQEVNGACARERLEAQEEVEGEEN